jgi:hypothetical protein
VFRGVIKHHRASLGQRSNERKAGKNALNGAIPSATKPNEQACFQPVEVRFFKRGGQRLSRELGPDECSRRIRYGTFLDRK